MPPEGRTVVREINLQGVSFAYGDSPVLRDINFSIPAGDFLAIVGPNGGGKSTLLRLVAGLLQPAAGRIDYGVAQVADLHRSRQVAYVPQNYAANLQGFPVTVNEVVALGVIREKKREAQEKVQRMLQLVGLDGLGARRLGELSGGQQQRAMVAMALVGSPQLLLLDEPTSGIDYDASNRLFQLLAELNQELGITIVMVSHDIEKATQWVKRIACVNRGLCFIGDAKAFSETHTQVLHLWYYTGG